MKKLLKCVILLLAVAVIFSGCSVISFDSAEIMRPPKATGDKAEIQNIIAQKAGAPYTLKYPQNGKYKSAITMFDIDSDSVFECVALFKKDGDEEPIHVLIMDEFDGKWKAVGDFSNEGAEIERIDFADLNGDGVYEIIVGWNIMSGGINRLTAYFVDGTKVFEAACDSTYVDFVIDSFSKDSKTSEIMLFNTFNGEESATARLIGCKDAENPVFVTTSSVEMNNEITSYVNILSGKISKEQIGVAVDGMSSSGDYSTQVIYYNQNISSLVNSHYNIAESKTTRKSKVLSSDIDNDGIIEVPISTKMEKELNEKEETVADQICWSQYIIDSNSFLANQTAVINNKYGYSITMPDNWIGRVTARVDDANGTMTFYEWISKKNSSVKGDALLTVKVLDVSNWMNENDNGKFLLATKNSQYAYTYMLSDIENKLLPDDETVKGMFVIANE